MHMPPWQAFKILLPIYISCLLIQFSHAIAGDSGGRDSCIDGVITLDNHAYIGARTAFSDNSSWETVDLRVSFPFGAFPKSIGHYEIQDISNIHFTDITVVADNGIVREAARPAAIDSAHIFFPKETFWSWRPWFCLLTFHSAPGKSLICAGILNWIYSPLPMASTPKIPRMANPVICHCLQRRIAKISGWIGNRWLGNVSYL